MMNYFLSEINIYPVKSLGGISLTEADVTDRGLRYDRRWMLVDYNGDFITQRTHPQISLIEVKLEKDFLKFVHKTNSQLNFSMPLENPNKEKIEVVVWDDKVKAECVSAEADDWFSEALKIKCRMVYMPDESKRFVDRKYASANEVVSFADAYPFLMIGQESLDDLNSRLKEKIKMNRFRPNFVFTGGEPFDEDKIKSFKIDNVTFYPIKPCSRCVITTIEQETGIKEKEPFATLASYRTQNNKVMFGQNLLHTGRGKIKLGSKLESIEWK